MASTCTAGNCFSRQHRSTPCRFQKNTAKLLASGTLFHSQFATHSSRAAFVVSVPNDAARSVRPTRNSAAVWHQQDQHDKPALKVSNAQQLAANTRSALAFPTSACMQDSNHLKSNNEKTGDLLWDRRSQNLTFTFYFVLLCDLELVAYTKRQCVEFNVYIDWPF